MFITTAVSHDDDIIAPSPSGQLTVTDILRKIIRKYEKTKSRNINVMNISRKYNLQHRRVYDLFNLLTALRVCKSIERGKIAWVSSSEAIKTIANEYQKIEIDSLSKSMKQIYEVDQSPNLGVLGTKFLSLYLFLDVQVISLKGAILLFYNPIKQDLKNLERRCYLVLGMLEVIGLITHMKRKGEYKLAIDIAYLKEEALQKKKLYAQEHFPFSIEAQLNTLDRSYIASLDQRRREEFQKLMYYNSA